MIAMDCQFSDSVVEKLEDALDHLLVLQVERKEEIKFINVAKNTRRSIDGCELSDGHVYFLQVVIVCDLQRSWVTFEEFS